MSDLDALMVELGGAPSFELPVERLSPSSIDGFWKCAEQWRREKVEKDRRPVTVDQLFGSAFDRAASTNFRQKIESHEDISVVEMRDVAGDSFNTVVEEEKEERGIDWYETKPATLQAEVITQMVGNDSLPGFHQVLAPTIQPVTIQRWFEVPTVVGVPFVGKIDVETDRAQVRDMKTTKKAHTQADIDKNTQATGYLWAREREGDPAADFGTLIAIRTIKPQQQELVTTRTAEEIAQFDSLLLVTAQTISHFMNTYGPDGPWPGASPLGWWCSKRQCSFYGNGCPWRQ
ncbi:MAG: PD-(D/E)XK nuclease family protein [Gemmatimonadaceae bacterium]|nr:PD-(D/E)XK nuclease family protein [Gemmatimonadaceae bacterium]